MDTSFEFLSGLSRLRGLECWAVAAGKGSGSHVTLDLGQKIERARPLKNPLLPDVLRKFKGEFAIFVQNCAWRLDADAILCTSKSPNDSDGPMVSGLQALVGRTVVVASAVPTTYDLIVEFSGGHTLRLFCDCFDQESDGNNYSLHTGSTVFTVCAGGMLVVESKRGIPAADQHIP